jgi:hypothetical protein
VQPTRPGVLAALAAAGFVAGIALSGLVASITGGRPGAPWITTLLLAFLVVVLLWARRLVHKWLDEPDRVPGMDGLRAGRLVVLAKAGSVFGALVSGGYTGFAVAALGDLDRPYGRDVVLRCLAAAVAGGLVAAAALALERACQLPPPSDPTAASEAGAPA